MCRPHLILLLIFLEVIYDSSGVNKVAAIYSDREYKAPCVSNDDCKEGLACGRERKCICDYFNRKTKFARQNSFLIFNNATRQCESPVTKLCTLPNMKDRLAPIVCIPNAFCLKQPHLHKVLPVNIFGMCTCVSGFVESDNHLCEPASSYHDYSSNRAPAMNRQVYVPENVHGSPARYEQVSRHEVGGTKEVVWTPGTPTRDADDPNKHLDVDQTELKYSFLKPDFERRSGSDGSTGGGRLQIMCFSLLIVFVFNPQLLLL